MNIFPLPFTSFYCVLLRCRHKGPHSLFYPLFSSGWRLNCNRKVVELTILQPNVTKNISRWLSLHIFFFFFLNTQNSQIVLYFPGRENDGELYPAVKKDEFLLCTKRGQLGGLPFQSILSGKRFKTKGKQPFLTSWTGAKLTLATQASVDRSLARLTALSSWHHFRATRYPSPLMLLYSPVLTLCHQLLRPVLSIITFLPHFHFPTSQSKHSRLTPVAC